MGDDRKNRLSRNLNELADALEADHSGELLAHLGGELERIRFVLSKPEASAARTSDDTAQIEAPTQPYVVLYWEAGSAPADVPLVFECQADDTEHAEEQCENAYPDCNIAWVVQTDDVDAAWSDYWGHNEELAGARLGVPGI